MSDHSGPAETPSGQTPGVPLDDGTYDAFVIEAEGTAEGGTRVDLTITAGEHKGQVLSLASSTSLGDPIELLGMPATITVSFGTPSVQFDR
ncbi:MAG TPA: hypothetical protein PLS63_10910 [Microthrixaceae bacterium]|nr:hypothetical protein [Microthrixaceae bacterium]